MSRIIDYGLKFSDSFKRVHFGVLTINDFINGAENRFLFYDNDSDSYLEDNF